MSFRDLAAYLQNVHCHIPLTTVADQVPSQVVDKTIVEWSVRELNGKLEVVVGLVEFVPEEYVRLNAVQCHG